MVTGLTTEKVATVRIALLTTVKAGIVRIARDLMSTMKEVNARNVLTAAKVVLMTVLKRPSYNREGGDRPYRPRFNSGEGGGYRSNNGGGGYRPRYNNDRQGGYRPRPRTGDYDPNAKYSLKKQIEYKEQFIDPNEPIRLNKFLANAGVCSRREADEFITAGVVSVNGEVVTELGTKIKRSDVVKFHDEPVSIERKVYVLLNKPKDTVTTSDDPQERRTVMDLVKGACNERIYPVGRLAP